MTQLSLTTARSVARHACEVAGVTLVTPVSPSMLRGAIRAAIAATTPLTLDDVTERISVFVPRIVGEIASLLPEPVLSAYPVDRSPVIYLSDRAWNDPVDLVGIIAHELGHAAQDVVACRTGILGGVAHGVAYLVCDVARADAEATCYVADLTAHVVLEGADALAYTTATLASLKSVYRLDDHALAHAKATLESASASLACGVLHGTGTPIEGILRDLRDRGVAVEGVRL